MSPQPRPRWSPMRILTLIAAAALTLILALAAVAAIYYTGGIEPSALAWAVLLAAAVCWVAYIAAHIRDCSIANQRLMEQRILARLDQLTETVADYGDRREIAGHVAATSVNGHRGRLFPVD